MTSDVIGRVTARFRVVVERGPVAKFAEAVLDRDPGAAVPPTFPFAARYWGAYPELQEGLEPVGPDAIGEIMGGLMAGGGLILHGEQSFEYHRPVVVGDVLLAESRIADLYDKESRAREAPSQQRFGDPRRRDRSDDSQGHGRTMTFLVIETLWTDDTTGRPVLTERMNLIHRS